MRMNCLSRDFPSSSEVHCGMSAMSCTVIALAMFTLSACVVTHANDYANRLGSTHMAGCYNLSTEPYLVEGAKAIATMGAKVIKLQLSNHETQFYQWNSVWPSNLSTPLDTAKYSYFQQVFSMHELHTYIMTTYTSLGGTYWRNGVTPQQLQQESDEMYDVALYLLRTYQNKTFIFSNWEGDWAIRGDFNKSTVPSPEAIAGMKQWYQARQDGVSRARQEYHKMHIDATSVRVYLAAEVNLVVQAMQNNSFPDTIISVIPYVQLDLIAYSSYDSQCSAQFVDALQFIAQHHNQTAFSPNVSVYIGEFGLPQIETTPEKLQDCVQNVVNTAYEFGCPFIMFWELYDNECVTCPNQRCTQQTGTVTNISDLRGFWLILPNATYSWPYHYFQSLYYQ